MTLSESELQWLREEQTVDELNTCVRDLAQ